MAYPPKRTPELIAEVLRLVAEGKYPEERKPLSLKAACGEVGISRMAWSKWESEDQDLASRREVAMARGQSVLEQRALDADISGPSANVIRHRLGRLDVDGWGDVVVNVDGGKLGIAEVFARERDGGGPATTP